MRSLFISLAVLACATGAFADFPVVQGEQAKCQLVLGKYGKEHPEYYPLVNGKRRVPPDEADQYAQPCTSDPAFAQPGAIRAEVTKKQVNLRISTHCCTNVPYVNVYVVEKRPAQSCRVSGATHRLVTTATRPIWEGRRLTCMD